MNYNYRPAKKYMDKLEKELKEVRKENKNLRIVIKRFENTIISIKDICSSLEFSAPENYPLWIHELKKAISRTHGIEVIGVDDNK